MNHRTIPSPLRLTQDRDVHGPQAASSGFPTRLGLLVLLVLLFGCAPMMPTAKERAAIHSGDKSLVLVRVQCTVDDQPFEPCLFKRDASMLSDNIFVGFAMGSFETFGNPGNAAVRALSEESFDAGWAFFVLSPGIHYLYVRGPDSSEIARRGASDYYGDGFRDLPRWRINVPEHAKSIYAGTLHLAGKVRGTLLFGDRIIDPVNGQEVSDDRDLADRLLVKHYPGMGEVRTILMQRWDPGNPIILRSPLPGPIK
jgi:hypothetical protein